MKRRHEKPTVDLAEVRAAVARYMNSEGCGCCSGTDHETNSKVLGKLLRVRKYKDGSGYDFYHYAKKKTP
jgi:hypothetical protein